MSAVVLILEDLGTQVSKASILLFKELGISVAVVKAAAFAQTPVMIRRLFDRTDPGFPGRLAAVLEQLDEIGCRWTAFELLDGQVYSKEGRYFEITPSRLRNLIETHFQILEEQRRLMELEVQEDDGVAGASNTE